MEHVNIISQEAITRNLLWPTFVVACVATIFLIWALVLCLKEISRGNTTLSDTKPIRLMLHGMACIPILILVMIVCNFVQVPTGRYKYEGTLDPEMTIVEFEEFQQQYSNVRFEDGVWKWEDKE